ncbi:hypothetical protein ACFQL1_14385 [Halomicroarcula sp. GCM10025709]|uniref:hypothetical protein n=1 Tax=Halomicroarcula sp. GCM10025709 TaxID=3252669 RepID=UPI003615A5B7
MTSFQNSPVASLAEPSRGGSGADGASGIDGPRLSGSNSSGSWTLFSLTTLGPASGSSFSSGERPRLGYGSRAKKRSRSIAAAGSAGGRRRVGPLS